MFFFFFFSIIYSFICSTSTVITMYLPALWVSTIKKCFLFCDIRATMFLQYVIMPGGRLPENFWP